MLIKLFENKIKKQKKINVRHKLSKVSALSSVKLITS